MNRSVCYGLTVVLLSGGLFAVPVQAAPTNQVIRLNQDLAEIQERQRAVQVDIAASTRLLQNKEHELSYSDPEAARLREQVKALERKMVDLRRKLRERLRMIEVIRTLEEQRKKSYLELQKLKEHEALILNEIHALKN